MISLVAGASAVTFLGLWAGGALLIAVERTSIWLTMSPEAFSRDFTQSIRRVDPLQPILASLGIAAGSTALMTGGGVSWIWGCAVAAAGLGVVSSLIVAEPMNSTFRRAPLGTAPEGAVRLRGRWIAFHRARTVVAITALVLAAVATSLSAVT